MVNGLHSDLERSRNGSMIGDICFITLVVEVLNTRWLSAPAQNTVAPCRNATLLRRVILRRTAVVFVRRSKSDGRLNEVVETEGAVVAELFTKLIMDKELVELSRMNCRDNSVSPLINTVVQIAIKL